MYNKVTGSYIIIIVTRFLAPLGLYMMVINNTTTTNNNNENRRNDREGTEMDSFSELRNCEMVYVAIIVVT